MYSTETNITYVFVITKRINIIFTPHQCIIAFSYQICS